MHSFPHHYKVIAAGKDDGSISISASGLPDISTAPPAEFDGPGDQWSPETLLTAAVADCFVLSFRAIAAASKFEWAAIDCETQGTLDRIDRVTRFTELVNTVCLKLPEGSSETRARSLLEKAENACLISNSLSAETRLVVQIEFITL